MRREVQAVSASLAGLGLWAIYVGTAGAADPTVVLESAGVASSFPGEFDFDEFVALWWIFPVSVVFSLIALAAGVSGALFFSPFFMLGVGLAPAQAIGAGLLTEVFGMGNGIRSYVKQGLVDYDTAKWLVLGALPAIVAGALAVHLVPEDVLRGVFGAGLLLLGGFLVYNRTPERCGPGSHEGEYLREKNSGRGKTVVEASDGERYVFDTCWRPPGVALASIGGFVTGLISAGLPEIVTTQLIVRCRVPPRVAVATSVFVLGVVALAGAAVHALNATPVWSVVAWSIPGVVVGGTAGTHLGKHVPSETMENALGIVFVAVGIVVLATTFGT